MKHKLQFLLPLILVLLLSGCGVSQTKYDALLNENKQLKEEIDSLSEHATPETETESSQVSPSANESTATSQASELDELQARAEALAKTSKDITSGSLYDTVTSIFDNVSITYTADGTLSIMFNFEQGTPEENITQFFSISEQICQSYDIAKEYSGVNFMIKTDEGLLALLSLYDYKSSVSFTSELTVFKSKYDAAFTTAYEQSSLNKDIKDYMNQTWQQLYLNAWGKSAFGDNSICFANEDASYLQCFSGNTYSISEDGISELWTDFKNSLGMLGYIQREVPDAFFYETISIKFFDPSDTYILDIVIKYKDNTYYFDSIACNIYYFDTIIATLASLLNS